MTAGPPAMPVLVPDAPSPVPLDLDGLDCGERNPVPAEGRLLTRLQYQNTVQDLFGGIVTGVWTDEFPAENEILRYRTNAEFHRATPWLVEAQVAAAEAVASAVIQDLPTLLPCESDGTVETEALACAKQFLDDYGARAFRRPLTDAERDALVELFTDAFGQEGFAYAIESLVQALLLSPQFLYRLEASTSSALDGDSGFALDSYELASRLSYLLWNTMPDAELWSSAQSGKLVESEELRSQALRMLESPRCAGTIVDFSEQWLGLAGLPSAVRRVGTAMGEDGTMVDVVNSEYSSAWQRSLGLFVTDLFVTGGTFASLLTSPRVFVNSELAALYPPSKPFDGDATTFVGVDYPAAQRSGILTQPALMALLSHPDQSAPILRGVFVRDQLLCDPAPPPPPSVNPTPPALDPNATTRERFAQHTASSSCSGCHKLIDPIGLGFENYDELGRYRDEENGLPLDVSGEIVGSPEEALDGPFEGAPALAERLAGSPQAQACFISQWYRYGMGRVEQEVDLCSIRQTFDQFTESGGDLRSLLLGLVLSDAFRYRSVLPLVGEDEEAE